MCSLILIVALVWERLQFPTHGIAIRDPKDGLNLLSARDGNLEEVGGVGVLNLSGESLALKRQGGSNLGRRADAAGVDLIRCHRQTMMMMMLMGNVADCRAANNPDHIGIFDTLTT